MDNFEKFYAIRKEKVIHEVQARLKKSKKDIDSASLDYALERSRKYSEIVSEEGRRKLRTYYDENKEAIDRLLAEKAEITDGTIAQKKTEIDMSRFIGENMQQMLKKHRDKAAGLITSAFSDTRIHLININGLAPAALSIDNVDRFIEKYEEVGFTQIYVKELPICYDYLNKRVMNDLTEAYLRQSGLDRRQYGI